MLRILFIGCLLMPTLSFGVAIGFSYQNHQEDRKMPEEEELDALYGKLPSGIQEVEMKQVPASEFAKIQKLPFYENITTLELTIPETGVLELLVSHPPAKLTELKLTLDAKITNADIALLVVIANLSNKPLKEIQTTAVLFTPEEIVRWRQVSERLAPLGVSLGKSVTKILTAPTP